MIFENSENKVGVTRIVEIQSSLLTTASADIEYRDYSIRPPPDCLGMDVPLSQCINGGSRGTMMQTFPRKLHYLLTYAETSFDGLKNIVSWQPHGRCKFWRTPNESLATNLASELTVIVLCVCLSIGDWVGFVVHDNKKFVVQVLPK